MESKELPKPTPIYQVPREEAIDVINITDEKKIRDKWKENSRRNCAQELQKYTECLKENKLLVFNCKPLFKEANECLHRL